MVVEISIAFSILIRFYSCCRAHTNWCLTIEPVPFAGTIRDGETVKIECVDWTGGQIGNNDNADDMRNVDLTKVLFTSHLYIHIYYVNLHLL